jgi:MFS family permease
MTTDLHLSQVDTHTKPPTRDTSRLSWATSMFYFGMLAGLYPMTFALPHFNMGRILGVVVCLWSLTCMLTAAVTSWRGLYAQRFFLGFVESIIPTGFMGIVSSFYTQREQSLRQSCWFSSTGLFIIIGGALNYEFGQIEGGDLKRRQYIYLLAGALTFLFGLCCCAVPDSPVSTWFLTKEERVVATERLRNGQTGVRCTKFKWSQIRETFLDIKVWLVALMMASAYIVNGAVNGFGPLIVSTFGYSTLDSILFQFPLGGMFHFHPVDWLSLFSYPQYKYHTAYIVLPASHCRLCPDMEKLMALPCCFACGRVFYRGLLRCCRLSLLPWEWQMQQGRGRSASWRRRYS